MDGTLLYIILYDYSSVFFCLMNIHKLVVYNYMFPRSDNDGKSLSYHSMKGQQA